MANDLLTATIKALRVYLERGEAALRTLEGDASVEAFLELLSLRDAAFHNFKALDAQLVTAGFDVAQDEEAQALWAKAQKVNFDLSALLSDASSQMATRLRAMTKAQGAAKAYHSGRGGAVKFLKGA